MITIKDFGQIKYLSEKEKMSVSQISTELNIDKKTARKWIKSNTFERTTSIQSPNILDEHKDDIKSLLERCSDYSSVQIFQNIKEKGYEGEITTVRDFVRSIRSSNKKVYATLDFAKGEAAQVDFGYCGYIHVGNAKRRLYVFSMVLCYSRQKYMKFIMKQNQEHFLQCHQDAFEFFGGIPQKIMVDNCKVAVLTHPKYGNYTLNPVYAEFAKYHGFEIAPCGVRKPNEKGQVEKSIDYIKRGFLRGLEITTLDALNFAGMNWLEKIANVRLHGTTKRKPEEMLEEEKEFLINLPVNSYDCGIIENVKSNNQFRVHFEGNKYSVPAIYASSHLMMKKYPDKLLFYYNDKLIARHERNYAANQDVVDDNHNKEFLKEKLRAKEQKELIEFLNISPKAEFFYKRLQYLCRPVKQEVKRILALKDMYSSKEIGQVLEDCLEMKAINASSIENILGARNRFMRTSHPLHITRNSECLDIEIEKPNLNKYNKIINNTGV